MNLRSLMLLALALVSSGQNQSSGVKVSGRVTGYPTGAPNGLVRIVLTSATRSLTVPVGADGAFQFTGVAPGRAVITSTTPGGVPRKVTGETSLDVNVEDWDIEGLQFSAQSAQLLGQVTIDNGAPLAANRNSLEPVFRLEARSASGNLAAGIVVGPQFVRSDGVFGFLPLPSDDYRIRVTLLPAGYAVKSISYSGVDALRAPITLAPTEPYAFLRVVLTAVTPDQPSVPEPRPDTADIAPAVGDASLRVSQTGQGPLYTDGFWSYFSVRSTDNGGIREERRLGGEWCVVPFGRSKPGCYPTNPQDGDWASFSLPAGNYELSSNVFVLGGGSVGRTDECRALFVIRHGETLQAVRVQSQDGACTLKVGR